MSPEFHTVIWQTRQNATYILRQVDWGWDTALRRGALWSRLSGKQSGSASEHESCLNDKAAKSLLAVNERSNRRPFANQAGPVLFLFYPK